MVVDNAFPTHTRAALSIKDDEGFCIRAALSGEILLRVPHRPATLREMRELVHKAMKRPVPQYCLDLVGQAGMLLKSDSDYVSAGGACVDVVVVRRKVVCGECFERVRCFCNAHRDNDCACTEEVNGLCSWCMWARNNSTPLMEVRSAVF